jgi:hypothetical protein
VVIFQISLPKWLLFKDVLFRSTLATALDTTIECSDTEALTNAQSLIPIAKIIGDANVTNITKSKWGICTFFTMW